MTEEDRRQGASPEWLRRHGIFKFYIANLPDRCSGTDVGEVLKEYGNVFRIYIAKKRDRDGKRFGFASFKQVRDAKDLEDKMQNVHMGKYHLTINIAKFAVENSAQSIRQEQKKKEEVKSDPVHSYGERQTGVSFKEALAGGGPTHVDDEEVCVDDSEEAFGDLHGRALVLRMLDLPALMSVNVTLASLGASGGRLQYLGGLSVFVSFPNAENAEEVRLAALKLNDVFSAVTRWEGQTFYMERLAWIKVQGVPLHLLTNEVVNRIASKFGIVLHKANIQSSDGDLSYEYVGVLVGEGKKINSEVVLNWKGRKFRVWVMEEHGEWVPEFLKSGKTEETNPNTASSSSSDHGPTGEEAFNVSEGISGNRSNQFNEDINMGSPICVNSLNEKTGQSHKNPVIDATLEEGEIGMEEQFKERSNEIKKTVTAWKLTKKRKKIFKFKRSGTKHGSGHSSSNSGPTKKKQNRPVCDGDPFDLDRLIGPMDPNGGNEKVVSFAIGQENNFTERPQEGFNKDAGDNINKGESSSATHRKSLSMENTNLVNNDRNTGVFTKPFTELLYEEDEELIDGNSCRRTNEVNNEVPEEHIFHEVNETITLGDKLGANIGHRQDLIYQSVIEEGKQGVLK